MNTISAYTPQPAEMSAGVLSCVLLPIRLIYDNLINMTENKDKKEYFSTSELAHLLGVSNVAIFKKIKSGKIKAFKVGRNYIIPVQEFYTAIGTFVSPEKKTEIDDVVKKAVEEYGDTLRRLGKE